MFVDHNKEINQCWSLLVTWATAADVAMPSAVLHAASAFSPAPLENVSEAQPKTKK